MIENDFVELLTARDERRLPLREHECLAFLKRRLPILDALSERRLFKGAVSLLDHLGDLSVRQNAGSIAEPFGDGIHRSNVRDEQVLEVRRLSPHLAIKVEACLGPARPARAHTSS